MGKNFMSYVLACVMTFSLALNAFAVTPTATQGAGPRGQVHQEANIATPSLAGSELASRIAQVFIYASGILTAVESANGSITLFDAGQVRATFALDPVSGYQLADVNIFGTDRIDSVESFLKSLGATPNQLMGGSDPGAPEGVAWLGAAESWLAGGINRSVSVNLTAPGGANVTMSENGRQLHTLAWDGEQVATFVYDSVTGHLREVHNVVKELNAADQALMERARSGATDLSEAEINRVNSIAENPLKFLVSAVHITTFVAGRQTATFDSNGTRIASFTYDALGAMLTHTDLRTNQTTHFGPNGPVSVTQTNDVGDARPTTVIATYTYNLNGTLNNIVQNNNGNLTTTVFVNGVDLATFQGTGNVDAKRTQALNALNHIATGSALNVPSNSMMLNLNIAPSILRAANNTAGHARIAAVKGWDSTANIAEMVTRSLASSNNISTAMSISFSVNAATQPQLNQMRDSLQEGANSNAALASRAVPAQAMLRTEEATPVANEQHQVLAAQGGAQDRSIFGNFLHSQAMLHTEEATPATNEQRQVLAAQPQQVQTGQAQDRSIFGNVIGGGEGQQLVAVDATRAVATQTAVATQATRTTVAAHTMSDVAPLPASGGRFASSVTLFAFGQRAVSLNFADRDPALSRMAFMSIDRMFNLNELRAAGILGQDEVITSTMDSTRLFEIIEGVQTRVDEMMNKPGGPVAGDVASIVRFFNAGVLLTEGDNQNITSLASLVRVQETVDGGRVEVMGRAGVARAENELAERNAANRAEAEELALGSFFTDLRSMLQAVLGQISSGDTEGATRTINETRFATQGYTQVRQNIVDLDPVVVGNLVNVVSGADLGLSADRTFVEVSADLVDIMDGQGFQAAAGETIFVEITGNNELIAQLSARASSIAAGTETDSRIMFMGDVIADSATGRLKMVMRVEYSGGVAIGENDVNATMATYMHEQWAINNMAFNMSFFTQQFGNAAIDWQTGWSELARLVRGEVEVNF